MYHEPVGPGNNAPFCKEKKAATKGEPHVMLLRDCPVSVTVKILSGKWKPLLLLHLKSGPQRYADLRAQVTEPSEKVFIEQLRQLQRDGIVDRFVSAETPPRVDYAISAYGLTLVSVLQQMADWGARHREREAG